MINSMLPCIYSVIDHRWSQNVVRTKRGAHKPQPGVSLKFLSQFYVICDLLLNRPMETRYLFDNSVMSWHNSAYYTYAGGFHTVMYSSCLSITVAISCAVLQNCSFSVCNCK